LAGRFATEGRLRRGEAEGFIDKSAETAFELQGFGGLGAGRFN
jgi:hypothetical protein